MPQSVHVFFVSTDNRYSFTVLSCERKYKMDGETAVWLRKNSAAIDDAPSRGRCRHRSASRLWSQEKNWTEYPVQSPRAALGVDIHKDELGNETVQVGTSGVIANLAENEIDAINQLRRFLSYMPQSVYEMAPRAMTEDDPNAVRTN